MEAKNPHYRGLRVVDRDDLFCTGFSSVELNTAYARLVNDRHDEGLILESPSLGEVDAFYNPGEELVCPDSIFEAVTVDKFIRTEKRMLAVVRVFNRYLGDSGISALEPDVGKPKKSGAFAYVTVQIPFSDGQSVSIVFHAPEGDKRRIAPNDTIIAFRWLLNKRDITHTVAPEDGTEVSLEEIAKRITQLVIKNTVRFEKQQRGAQEERKALEEARTAAEGAEERQSELMDSIAATAKQKDTTEAQLSNTLTLLERQKGINAELQAKIDGLEKARPPVAGKQGGNPITEKVLLELPSTDFRPEEMRVVTSEDKYLVQTRRTGGDWITQKVHATEDAALEDAKAWYPEKDSSGTESPGFVRTLHDILAGKYDSDTARIGSLLDAAAEDAEKAGAMEEHDALFNQAADHLTVLLKKRAA